VQTTVVRRVPPLRYMHLRGILWVFFRVLLVGFSLFRPGAARALDKRSLLDLYLDGDYKLILRLETLALY
jgi:hypothetical protein